ncbi:MAG: bifunctional acetate--CoA ligase family protein/GNAT family N-acetyltransferase [Bacteroidales bacterium]|nr:bifunctional acetate--CoA ligase family protein/GNAT family N-acetyltransferase [Bacteroidales bacterium]MCF8344161.1 bifunctional acetate--CoA ligase family protein/GNAT family N-acetyltransferase [Bacteroidales bacterium]MCF8351130.1 bifunctional acetate--CoA ligase family protein/GNAT family N-acetyltransferase [Bacteroidales bacterium]MCF8374808.1 bifunctional acetate--CoA ligase family protein/GNAT family N-acetyltransferase [Bacteroidales bacterium]MCF8399788.1 bifunctional acetate--Co
MGIRKLGSIFRPQRIALIGVKNDPKSVGGITLSNLVGGGFKGVVYPVNPKHEAVLGIQCFPNVASLPKTPDLAVITTGAQQVPQIIRECGEAGINGVIIMSAGFKEIGPEGKALEDRVKAEKEKYPDMRVIGPNCLGVIIPGQHMNVSFAASMPKQGHVAFISQSGALCTSVLDWALEENLGFSYFVSIGNSMDVNFGDLIDYFGQDPNTKSIVLYVESISQARSFMTAARAFARKKPIIVYKAGRFPESAKAAASHTGAMASEDSIYNAVFRRAGIARVYDIGDIFDFTDLIGRKRIPKGSKLAIVTNAGGPGVMATDTLLQNEGKLCKLSDETIQRLNDLLPPFWSHGNPVDVLGDATPERFANATKIVLEDQGVDAVLVILTPQAMTDPTRTAEEIAHLSENTTKPIMAAWLGGKSMNDGIGIFNNSGIAVYQTPEQAIRAFMTLVRYARNLDALFETPQDIPLSFTYDRKQLREKFVKDIFSKEKILSEDDSKALLKGYGIKTTSPVVATNEKEAVKVANEIGYPVVMKILSADITHKSDVGGVALNLANDDMVKATYKTMMSNIAEKNPDTKLEGVTIQPMIDTRDAVELILGIKKDPVFGTTLLVGMGGTEAELFQDTTLGFPPLNERLARHMLESLKIYPLLKGFRGSEPKNIDKIVEVMIRMSYLAADYPEIEELDINPIIVTKTDAIALDARIVTDQDLIDQELPEYSHLIIHPYPEKYVKESELSDGTPIILRPIKPEDEPLWLELLSSCSKESIYSRFRYNFHYDSHEIATQFCFIDYSREIAIVAEIQYEGRKRLIGVGRLIADPDHETVEYAVLIADQWQQKDLGTILTSYCLEIANTWNLNRIIAQTTTDNKPMVNVFKKLGFRVNFNPDGTVDVSKELD